MISYLLSISASPDISIASGTYPIHFAAGLAASDNHGTEKEKGYAIIKILRESGADLNKRNRDGKTAYQLCDVESAIRRDREKVSSPLQQNSIFQNDNQSLQDKLYNAVTNGEPDNVTKYLTDGADCNYIYNNTKHKTLINYLLTKTKMDKNDLEILNVLLNFDANVGLYDDNKNTSLDIICNRTDISDALREQVLNLLLSQHEKNSASEIIKFKP